MRAVLLVDEGCFNGGDPNFASHKWPKRAVTEYSVGDALRSLGHEVIGVPATVDVVETIKKIQEAKPDFVFNLVEEIGGRREYDSIVVRILEFMNIPYEGASPEALTLGRNKHLSKLVAADAGVPVPAHRRRFTSSSSPPGRTPRPASPIPPRCRRFSTAIRKRWRH